MREWHKYGLNYENALKFLPKDKEFSDHKKSMGGYEDDKGYNSKKDFFEFHFYRDHSRLKHYHNYLRQVLKKEEVGLSIGSGRCVNELLLKEDGYNIICSDLEQPCKEKACRIFPNLRFAEFDITLSPFEYKVDYVLCLGVFFLFDEEDLLEVFKNVADTVKPGGKFIFDPGGAEDNLFTYTLDEFICKHEVWLKWIVQNVIRQKRCVVAKKHHGYRNKNEEIISVAEEAGFTLCDLKCSDYLTECERSILLRMLPKKIIDRVIGPAMPYVRMFAFVKN